MSWTRHRVTERRDDDSDWLRVAVSADAETTDLWQETLQQIGIDAQIRLEDTLEAAPGSTVLPGYLPAPTPFSFSLFVPYSDRHRARAALIDAGWHGRPDLGPTRQSRISSREVLAGAIVAVASVLFIALLRLFGS